MATEKLAALLKTKEGVCASWIRLHGIVRGIVDTAVGVACVEWDIDGRLCSVDCSTLADEASKKGAITALNTALRGSAKPAYHCEPAEVLSHCLDDNDDCHSALLGVKNATCINVYAPSRLCAAFLWSAGGQTGIYDLYAGASSPNYMISPCNDNTYTEQASRFLNLARSASAQIHVPPSVLTFGFRAHARCVHCGKMELHVMCGMTWMESDGKSHSGLCGACYRDQALYTLALATHGNEFQDDRANPARKRARAAVKAQKK